MALVVDELFLYSVSVVCGSHAISLLSSSPCAKILSILAISHEPCLGLVQFVEMHNICKIALVVLREALTITLSTEAISKNATIVRFHSHTRDKV